MASFAVESPLQVENALKIIKLKKIQRPIFLVRLNNCERNNELILSYIGTYNYKIVQKRANKGCGLSLFTLLLYFLFVSFRYGNLSCLYLGDVRSFWQKMLSIFFTKRISVDDGLATIAILNLYSKSKLLKMLNIEFLTFIPVDKSKYRNVKIDILKSVAECRKLDDKNALFIGSPLVENNILTFDDWLNLMISVRNNEPSEKDIIYSRHRYESDKVNVLNNFGFKVVTYDDSIERHLKQIDLPYKIMSYYSSALLNLSLSNYGPEYISFRLPVHTIMNSSVKSNIEDVYDIFKKSSIKVIELECRS